jgi:hypothetical protein
VDGLGSNSEVMPAARSALRKLSAVWVGLLVIMMARDPRELESSVRDSLRSAGGGGGLGAARKGPSRITMACSTTGAPLRTKSASVNKRSYV